MTASTDDFFRSCLDHMIDRKNPGKQGKLYSWHAPELECISKGKSRTPYEFGVKVGIATTLQGNLIVSARTFPGNPYDGSTERAARASQHLDAGHWHAT